MSTWRGLAPVALREECLSVAEEIGLALKDEPPLAPTLAYGAAGCALVHAYLEQALPDRGHGELALAELDRAIDGLATHALGPGLFTGLAGLGWVSEHLQGWLLDPGDDDANAEIDAAILDELTASDGPLPLDVIAGLSGICVYAEARKGRGQAHALFEQALAALHSQALRSDDQISWHADHPLEVGEGEGAGRPYFDLGLAHGVPGIIAALAGLERGGVAMARVQPLLAGAMRWQLARQLPRTTGAAFSYYVVSGREADGRPARNAWCRGDAGAAVSLLAGARSLGDAALEREALEIARLSARREDAHCGVRDAALCHGSAGLGLIYTRLFEATGEQVFSDAAVRWIEHTLAFREPGTGFAGFSREAQGKLEAAPGFLFGSAGIALSLVAFATEHEPRWDRLLLPSLDCTYRVG